MQSSGGALLRQQRANVRHERGLGRVHALPVGQAILQWHGRLRRLRRFDHPVRSQRGRADLRCWGVARCGAVHESGVLDGCVQRHLPRQRRPVLGQRRPEMRQHRPLGFPHPLRQPSLRFGCVPRGVYAGRHDLLYGRRADVRFDRRVAGADGVRRPPELYRRRHRRAGRLHVCLRSHLHNLGPRLRERHVTRRLCTGRPRLLVRVFDVHVREWGLLRQRGERTMLHERVHQRRHPVRRSGAADMPSPGQPLHGLERGRRLRVASGLHGVRRVRQLLVHHRSPLLGCGHGVRQLDDHSDVCPGRAKLLLPGEHLALRCKQELPRRLLRLH
jgi:hypothetical protein